MVLLKDFFECMVKLGCVGRRDVCVVGWFDSMITCFALLLLVSPRPILSPSMLYFSCLVEAWAELLILSPGHR